MKKIHHSAVTLARFLDPIPKARTVREDGRKIGEVGERDRVQVFCDMCGNL